MGSACDASLTPVTLGPYALSNRIVMSPMTRNRAGPGGVPQAMKATYYAQRASAGLIVTEASQVSPQGVGYPNTPGIHSPAQVEGWKAVTETVHRRVGRVFLRLFHGGRISHPMLQPGRALPVAPSAVRPEGEAFTPEGFMPFPTPRALEPREIPEVVAQFRKAAENALHAGFDGVEVHAANGYLPHQFLADGTNRRTDGYGGAVENRLRFTLEVSAAVVEVWGGDRVGVHLSPGNPFNSIDHSDPERTFVGLVEGLNRLGIAYLSVSEIDLASPGTFRRGNHSAALNPLTRRLRSLSEGRYITNGGYARESGEAVVSAGDADLVAFGRLFIANPDLPERFARGSPLTVPDESSFYGGGEEGYTDYPPDS